MTQQLPPRRFTPCTETATDYPVLLIDSDAPLLDLHACLRERLNAALEHLNLIACSSLPDFAERDLNNIANTARILVQDVSDVFRVIEHRGSIGQLLANQGLTSKKNQMSPISDIFGKSVPNVRFNGHFNKYNR